MVETTEDVEVDKEEIIEEVGTEGVVVEVEVVEGEEEGEAEIQRNVQKREAIRT